MLGLMKKFDRAAVLTDKTWLKKISEFKGALFPGLEIKAFDIDQKNRSRSLVVELGLYLLIDLANKVVEHRQRCDWTLFPVLRTSKSAAHYGIASIQHIRLTMYLFRSVVSV